MKIFLKLLERISKKTLKKNILKFFFQCWFFLLQRTEQLLKCELTQFFSLNPRGLLPLRIAEIHIEKGGEKKFKTFSPIYFCFSQNILNQDKQELNLTRGENCEHYLRVEFSSNYVSIKYNLINLKFYWFLNSGESNTA